MSLIISTYRNSIFRSEEIAAAHLVHNEKTGRCTNVVSICLKSGAERLLMCKTVKEAKIVFENIIEIIINEYVK